MLEPALRPAVGRRNLVVLPATTGALMLSLFSWNRVLPLILRELGASDFHISVAYSAVLLSMGLMQYPGGLLADRYGRRPLICYPTFVAGGAYIAGALVRDWRAMVAMVAVTSAMSSMQWPSFSALLAESVDARRRGTAFAMLELFISVAVAAGPALGAWVLPLAGFRLLMAATGVVAIAMGAVRLWLLHETLAPEHRTPVGITLTGLLDRQLVLLLATSTVFMVGNSLLLWGPFISIYASDVHGLSPSQVNLMFAAGPLAGIGVALLGGKLTDRYGSARALRVSAVAHALTMLCWMGHASFTVVTAWFTLSYVIFQVTMIAHGALRADATPAHARGAVLGAVGSAAQVAAAAGVPLGGALAAHFGPVAPFWLAAVFMAGTALLSRKLEVTIPRAEPLPGPAYD